MKSKVMLSLFAATILLSICTPAAFGQECFRDWQGLPPGAGVTFSQITYYFDGTDGQPSGTGQIDVNISQLVAYTGMNSGYLNVVDDAGWVVANLPVLPGFPLNDMSTTFTLDVSRGTLVTDLPAYVCYGPDALSQAPRYNNPLSYSDFAVNAIGFAADLTSEPSPPSVGFTFPGGPTYFSCQANHQNVQAANNQCAPAAVANNFQWLKDTYGIAIPDMNIPGLRDAQNLNSIVGHLDMDMWSCDQPAGRWANLVNGAQSGRLQGHGIAPYFQLAGALQYLNDNNIQLNLKHQGLSSGCLGFGFSGAINYGLGNQTSIGQGTIVQPSFIYNEIAAGRAVEWGWQSSSSGHAEDVICAGMILGVPFVARVSDHLQTDHDPGDNQGTGFVDFSLLSQPTGQQPILVGGIGSGATVVSVITQGP